MNTKKSLDFKIREYKALEMEPPTKCEGAVSQQACLIWEACWEAQWGGLERTRTPDGNALSPARDAKALRNALIQL